MSEFDWTRYRELISQPAQDDPKKELERLYGIRTELLAYAISPDVLFLSSWQRSVYDNVDNRIKELEAQLGITLKDSPLQREQKWFEDNKGLSND